MLTHRVAKRPRSLDNEPSTVVEPPSPRSDLSSSLPPTSPPPSRGDWYQVKFNDNSLCRFQMEAGNQGTPSEVPAEPGTKARHATLRNDQDQVFGLAVETSNMRRVAWQSECSTESHWWFRPHWVERDGPHPLPEDRALAIAQEWAQQQSVGLRSFGTATVFAEHVRHPPICTWEGP